MEARKPYPEIRLSFSLSLREIIGVSAQPTSSCLPSAYVVIQSRALNV